jgi:vacuolar-type H+-ATPase subunit H
MDTSDSKIREIWGRKFKIVKNGLDEAEVFSFIGGLIDQNNALASKLEHLDSLTKLAERTVIEASKQAQGTKKEAEEKANASAASIVAEAKDKARKEIDRIISEGEQKAKQSAEKKITAAEQQAQSMLTAAAEKAESIKTNADDGANRTIAEAKQNAIATEQQAQEILKAAEDKAESIKTDADNEANMIITEAKQNALAVEQQAQSMLAAAIEKAESIKTDADNEANRIITEAKQSALAVEQQAQSMLAAAVEKAESIKTNAEKKANRIISESKERAEDLVNARMASAEKEAQSILEGAKAKAEEEAHLIKQKSEQLLKRSKRISEGEIKEKLKRVYQGLLSGLEDIEETIAMPTELGGRDLEPAKPEAVAHAKAESKTKESQKQIPPSEEKVEVKEGPALYEGTVELVIPPPLGLDRMLQLHKHLRNIPNIEVLNLGVSADKSITIRVTLENPTPLRKILEELSEVETAVDLPQDAEMTMSTTKTGERTPVKRIIVTTKK